MLVCLYTRKSSDDVGNSFMTLLSPPSLTFPVIGSSADVRLELFLTDDSHPHMSILRL